MCDRSFIIELLTLIVMGKVSKSTQIPKKYGAESKTYFLNFRNFKCPFSLE